MRFALVAVLLLLAGCDEEARAPFHADVVVSRFAVDPATQLGDLLLRSESGPAVQVADQLDRVFGMTSCSAFQPVVLRLAGTRSATRGDGEASLLVVTPVGEDDPCEPGARAVEQPISFEDDGETPIVRGPLYLEGRTLEGRMPLGDVGRIVRDDTTQVLPRWWALNAVFTPPRDDADAGAIERPVVGEAELTTTWSGAPVLTPLPMSPDRTHLDALVAAGLQPDVDVDGDGPERFLDDDGDGRVDACLDGGGARIEGADCPLAPGMTDGYLLRLRFRVEPIALTDP